MNESSPEKLVKLVLTCASKYRLQGDEDEIGQGYVSYKCLTSPVGTISLPTGFAATGTAGQSSSSGSSGGSSSSSSDSSSQSLSVPSSDDASDGASDDSSQSGLQVSSQKDIGGLVVAGARVLGSHFTIHDSFQRDFQYNFAYEGKQSMPLWRQALFHQKRFEENHYFADAISFQDWTFAIVHDRKEGTAMLNDPRGLFVSLSVGEAGGNDFHGTGLFQLREVVKTRVGYHRCHAVNDYLCFLTHSSWERQMVDGKRDSFVDHIKTEQYDFAVGARFNKDYDNGVSLAVSVRGLLHSTPAGGIRLMNGSSYAIAGSWERRISSDITLSW